MNLEYVGAEQSFTVLAGAEREMEWEFERGGEVMELAGVTFDGVLRREEGEVHEVGVWHVSGEKGVLRVVFPAVEAGEWEYEIRYVTAAGVAGRVAFGVVGVLTTELVLGAAEGLRREVQRVLVHVPERAGEQMQMEWRASDAALAAARGAMESGEQAVKAQEAAQRAAEAARNAAAEAQGCVELLRGVQAFMEGFESAVRKVICVGDDGYWYVGGRTTGVKARGADGLTPHIGADGYWWAGEECLKVKARGADGLTPYIGADGCWCIGDVNTGVVARGRDGLNGLATRRILLESAEDLPAEGELCNGGVLVYVRQDDTPARAEVDFSGLEAGDVVVVWVDGVEVGGVSGAADFAAGVGNEEALGEVVAQVEGDVVRLESEGETLTVWTESERVRVTEEPRIAREGYAVYAWLERGEQGGAGWEQVGEANDIASTRVYGLMLLGTDEVVRGGAPVGADEHGRGAVPRMSAAVAGSAKVSTSEVLREGDAAEVGMSVSGALYGVAATAERYGAVKYSYFGVAEVPCIGRMSDGRAGVRWATLTEGGAVKLGSQYGQSNPAPYLVGIGATENHELANNYVFGGALQHRRPEGWRALGMGWLEAQMERTPGYFGDMYYSGLVTSASFAQTEAEGLVLVSGSADVLGGVYVVQEPGDERVEAVLSVSGLLQYLGENYLMAEDTWSREEVKQYMERTLEGYDTRETARAWVQSVALRGYATQEWVREQAFETRERAERLYMQCSPSARRLEVVKLGVLPAADKQEKGVVYLGV